MKFFVRLTLLMLLVLLAWTLFLHREVTKDAKYVTSENCQGCHTTQYDSWRKNSLHPYIFLPVSHANAKILGDFDSNDPAVTFKKEEIEYVVGGQWEQVYARILDGEYYPFPAKWYVKEKRWVPYKEKDWHATPMSYKCNGCHTTGFNPNTLEFTEFGIGCEACHGPGSLHVQHEKRRHFPVCKLCHDIEKLEAENLENRNIITSVSPTVCGQCHTRGTTTEGDLLKESQFNFPAGYKPGDDIRTESFLPETPEKNVESKNWWGNGLSKNRHQEFSDWNNSKHSKALTNLLGMKKGTSCTDGPVTESCLRCHSTDYRHAATGNKPTLSSARFGVTCVACHEPHGDDKELPEFSDGSASCDKCHTKLTDKDAKEHFPCPSTQVSCVDCHMPKIIKTGGFFSLHSHAFQVVPPRLSMNSDMPNSCQNTDCHSDKSLEWAIESFDMFYQDGNSE